MSCQPAKAALAAFALDRGLDDHAAADELGGHLHAHDAAVDQDADSLDVGLEGPRRFAGDLLTNAALLLGETAPAVLTTDTGLLAAERNAQPVRRGRR